MIEETKNNKRETIVKNPSKSLESLFDEFAFWVIAITVQDGESMTVHHVAGYESKPDDATLAALRKELRDNAGFGCRSVADTVEFIVVTPEVIVDLFA